MITKQESLIEKHFDQEYLRSCNAIDRLFVIILPLQWVVSLALAYWYSPYAWHNTDVQPPDHLMMAVISGAAATIPSLLMIWLKPGQQTTRFAIGISQMLWSTIFIHLSGGRIETHFHVFGSLAVLAFYRDWKVIVVATAVVAADHLCRGAYYPQSIFGVDALSPYRCVEHVFWVLIEDVFLLIAISQSRSDLALLCERQAELEVANESIVEERIDVFSKLEKEIHTREKLQNEKDDLMQQLLRASRTAGMAEVATGVLHNVGNVLNSVSVSGEVLTEKVQASQFRNIDRVVDMLNENVDHLAEFLSQNSKGKKLIQFLAELSRTLAEEQELMLGELENLRQSVEHLSEVVSMQQDFAKRGGVAQTFQIRELIDEAIRFNEGSLLQKHFDIVVDLEFSDTIQSDKHRLLQILINLISNAKHAVSDNEIEQRSIVIRSFSASPDEVTIEVEDNGHGISPENLTRIFNHGFTTKKDGHGFGLHSSANAAKELGGRLSVRSEGMSKGACFQVVVPKVADGHEPLDEAVELSEVAETQMLLSNR